MECSFHDLDKTKCTFYCAGRQAASARRRSDVQHGGRSRRPGAASARPASSADGAISPGASMTLPKQLQSIARFALERPNDSRSAPSPQLAGPPACSRRRWSASPTRSTSAASPRCSRCSARTWCARAPTYRERIERLRRHPTGRATAGDVRAACSRRSRSPSLQHLEQTLDEPHADAGRRTARRAQRTSTCWRRAGRSRWPATSPTRWPARAARTLLDGVGGMNARVRAPRSAAMTC